MLTGRRSMDKHWPNGEHNLVEWARRFLGERQRLYQLIDPRLESCFSIKGAQRVAQLAAQCLSRDPKARPLMSEVVEALKPLPNLKDMASSSSHFQAMLVDHAVIHSNARNGIRVQAGLQTKNGQAIRSLSLTISPQPFCQIAKTYQTIAPLRTSDIKSDVYSFGVVLLEMLTGRRSMDKHRPNGEHNLVEWERRFLGERRRLYQLIDPRLEGCFSIKGAQRAAQLAAQCLSRDPKAKPLMSEVVEALKPLPNLKDMASSSSHFQAMLADHAVIHSNARNGVRVQAGLQTKNGQAIRSLSMPNGPHPSPYRHSHSARSPKPTRQLHH
ncbi:hypothetical protein RJ640_025710 [Escallonia rubra]|uniref:Protein kinase domain-containing protein n=1 Tax=Escallonia rubra TaxID=112253 RepID=A0AA88R3Q4_9ASTE|nr:hypothetical protein RJ640_025710 [Escallonia rubra]